ncbi:helix-turn-helix transcriptional regulator (plasmid) [Halorarum halophilum]|jgi:DNA-binding MarR family transcriptional regulator|uniref:Helix-turn-helix transcriptional regulator n=1 Tax=Halorarum halophilum TaxID=2743090 RepID=A0A7D5L323_9EURY|nr:winged helix-turn-helix domain-containing protein [Halobaculum halophilum]QLG29783.1 helix-turn-helix transcriptional regulator [Halobaculum halophilum]
MSDDWDVVGYVISSRYRVAVLGRLADGPATPSGIADDEDLAVTHVSRALRGLRERDLVELLVPEERRKGRVYGITEDGRETWNLIQTKDLLD